MWGTRDLTKQEQVSSLHRTRCQNKSPTSGFSCFSCQTLSFMIFIPELDWPQVLVGKISGFHTSRSAVSARGPSPWPPCPIGLGRDEGLGLVPRRIYLADVPYSAY